MNVRAIFPRVFGVLLAFTLAMLDAHVGARDAEPAAQESVGSAEPLFLTVDPAKSQIHFSLESTLHTVHGTFRIKRGEIRIEPASGKASGEVVADATSGESGNNSRDNKMHKDVLESTKYADIIFRPDHVDGRVNRSGESDVQLHGIFTLHGTDHEMTIPAHATLDQSRWTESSRFVIPYLKWGLKNPSNFFLKVKPDVNVELELAGTVQDVAQ
jgi:polyisoprenoid-binding protein YceI